MFVSRPLVGLVLAASFWSLACAGLTPVECGPGTLLAEHSCLPAYPQILCGPGTSLSGATCIVTVVPDVVPNQDRMLSDLHGQVVNIPNGSSGLRAWTFSFPTEFHALVVEKQTEVGDVLQIDTRAQLEDFSSHERYTLWLTIVYQRVSSTWRFESVVVSDATRGWVDVRPAAGAALSVGDGPAVENQHRLPAARSANGRRPSSR